MNVQPGDMARIVSNGMSDMTPGIVDRIVEVIRPAVPGQKFESIEGGISTLGACYDVVWVVRSKAPLPMTCWWCGMDIVLHFNERPISDAHLRRLGGVPVDDEIRDEVPA